jgi:hypothetical protein
MLFPLAVRASRGRLIRRAARRVGGLQTPPAQFFTFSGKYRGFATYAACTPGDRMAESKA